MSTEISPYDQLLKKAQQMGRHKTKRAAVTAALKAYVEKCERMRIVERFGKVDYYEDYDYKAARNRKRLKVLS